ncbi:MAG: hypothetical protein ACE5GT_02930 [Rhodospirillales bacterium]
MSKGFFRAIKVTAVALVLGAAALPADGFFQVHGFFDPSAKYRDWFDADVWRRAAPPGVVRVAAQGAAQGGAQGAAQGGATTVAERYPYPEKEFVLTDERWREAVAAVQYGKPDWYDAEVVRQRAEMEEYPPAMGLLAWMFENGRGVREDLRMAYTWYQRAKLTGEAQANGRTQEIFDSLPPPAKFYARVQLAEDIKRLRKETEVALQEFKRVKVHVLKQTRELESLRRKTQRDKDKVKAIHR